MNKTVVVITGADSIVPTVAQRIPADALVIAADGALDHALAAGVTPAGLVGDMDSISTAGLEWAARHATVERHDPNKDHTDTELALMTAAELRPARLILIGAGNRLDHVLAAIGALGQPHLTSIPVIDAWWDEQWIRVVHGPGSATLELPGCGAVIVNGGQLGYFRTLYTPPMAAALAEALPGLAPIDQLGLLRDSFALAQGGYQTAGSALGMLVAVPADANPLVAQGAVARWDQFHDFATEAARAAINRGLAEDGVA